MSLNSNYPEKSRRVVKTASGDVNKRGKPKQNPEMGSTYSNFELL